jgi:hypothetical protein
MVTHSHVYFGLWPVYSTQGILTSVADRHNAANPGISALQDNEQHDEPFLHAGHKPFLQQDLL